MSFFVVCSLQFNNYFMFMSIRMKLFAFFTMLCSLHASFWYTIFVVASMNEFFCGFRSFSENLKIEIMILRFKWLELSFCMKFKCIFRVFE
jgi:hypothetical protein